MKIFVKLTHGSSEEVVTGVYQILHNLSFRSLWGVDFRTTRDRSYVSALLPRYASVGGSLTERYRETSAFNTNQIIEYQQSFFQHNLNVLGGFEYRSNSSSSFTASGEQFPNAVFSQLDLAAIQTGISGRSSESKFAGFLPGLNTTLITATLQVLHCAMMVHPGLVLKTNGGFLFGSIGMGSCT
jgi:hypothetical protein